MKHSMKDMPMSVGGVIRDDEKGDSKAHEKAEKKGGKKKGKLPPWLMKK